MKKYFTFKNIYYLCLIGFITIANLILIFNNNVWCDEAFVMNAAKLDFSELLQYIYNTDMRPPAYLLTAKLFTIIFGWSVPVLKFFSLIPAVLGMILGATVVDKNWGNNKLYTGTFFILLMGLAPITITKNIEISMYSWTMFCIVCSAIYAYNIICNGENKKNWIIFIISALGAAGTHYYAVLVEIFIYLFLYISLLVKDIKNLKKCIISALATIAGYLPILPFFFHQFGVAKDLFWIKETNLGTMLLALRVPFEGENIFTFTSEFTMIFWALILGSFLYLFTTLYSAYKEKLSLDKNIIFVLLCLLVIICYLGSCLVLSKLIRPLFINRYMYVAVGLLWLYISIVFGNILEEKYAAPMCMGLIVCFIIFGYPSLLDREFNTGTETTVSYLNSVMEEDDILINNIEECANWSLEYYFPEHETYLNCDEDSFYKNELYDFSKLNSTAWYLCNGELDIAEEIIEQENLIIEEMNDLQIYNIDNYYHFSIYKIIKRN